MQLNQQVLQIAFCTLCSFFLCFFFFPFLFFIFLFFHFSFTFFSYSSNIQQVVCITYQKSTMPSRYKPTKRLRPAQRKKAMRTHGTAGWFERYLKSPIKTTQLKSNNKKRISLWKWWLVQLCDPSVACSQDACWGLLVCFFIYLFNTWMHLLIK